MCHSLAPVGVISSACTVFWLGDNSRNYVRILHRWPADVAGYRSSGILTVVQSPVELDLWCQCNWFLTSSNTFPTSFPGITFEMRLSKHIERERPLNSQSLNLNSPFWLLSRCLQIIPRNLVLRQPNTPVIVFLTLYTLTLICLFSVLFFTASHGTDRENLFKNLEPHELQIISFILLTVTFDSGVIWYGETRWWSL